MIQYFKLEEVTELITCGVAKRPEYVEDGIPFLSAKNVKEDKIIYKDYKYVSEETHAQLTKHNKPLKGDILYTRVGSYGSASVIDVDIEFSIFVSLTLIKPKKDILNSRYLMYYLNSPKIKNLASNSINGVGVGNLNVGTVRKFLIPVPSLQEQEKIVERLDKVFKNINTKIKIYNLNSDSIEMFFSEYLDKYFSKKFNNTKKFSELIKTVENKKWSQEQNENYKYIEISSVSNTEFKISSYSEINNIDAPSRAKKIVLENDVLFATTRPTLKRVAVVPKEFNNQIASTGFFVFRLLDKIDSFFLFYYLISNKFKKIMKNIQKGASYPAVNESDIKNLYFDYPDIYDQRKFVNHVKEIDDICNNLQKIIHQKVNLLHDLRLSILSKEFSYE